MCAKQFHLGGRDVDAVLGSQGMYVGGRTLVKGLQWTHLSLWNPGTHHTLNRKLCRYTLKSSQDYQNRMACGAESSYDVYLVVAQW